MQQQGDRCVVLILQYFCSNQDKIRTSAEAYTPSLLVRNNLFFHDPPQSADVLYGWPLTAASAVNHFVHNCIMDKHENFHPGTGRRLNLKSNIH